ncbi:3'-5' exonuclease [Flavobacteriales bacterium]|jgi:predicted PolB exonuclease-like 3'-5' exonuclease|nr:3'-5' exonuclease [Flavobacteriales bacterium]MDC3395122.1 3'-5' exonuclease [Flavobacteriales bacterium]MDG1348367.1 3'-5' exonuclease [Flavobacteriales bacterium]|tara:strand:+ start:2938 stop:3657 length:720 start_codon:yes stop_codon:yes gene_type:complete
MLIDIKIKNILFLDIETVPVKENFEDLDTTFQTLWAEKTAWQRKDEYSPSEFYKIKAGVMAEFAKIVCISVGYLFLEKGENHFRLKSFYGDDEKKILTDFNKLLNTQFNKKHHQLCAHNGKEFDFPFIARRTLINGLQLPKLLDIAGKKPWEVNHLDTMELWRFGDYKNYTSIKLLAALFNIPTPKDNIDGSQVAGIYWKENDLERIKTYCQKDTLTVAQILLKYKGEELITEKNIEFV